MAEMSNNLRSRVGHIVAVAAFALLAAGALATTPALAAAGEGCPNEQLRHETNVNPTTGQPYSLGLPECRAYEMVSPLEKQQHDTLAIPLPPRISVSPEGNSVQWASEGAYAGAENYQVPTGVPANPYLAQRTASGWTTRSGYPPSTLIEDPFGAFGASGVYSPNLASETVCGGVTSTGAETGPTIRCAQRQPSGSWVGTPAYSDLTGQTFADRFMVGASTTGEDVVFYGQEGIPFLPADESEHCHGSGHCGGIYEEAGVGTASPQLLLVNVDNSGHMIGPETPNVIGALEVRNGEEPSAYQAISTDGSKIYFTATPTSTEVPTVYARIDGGTPAARTVNISNPAAEGAGECTRKEPEPECSFPAPAIFQGASADGSKVFFTTKQQLVNGDTDGEPDLYEYDFNNPPGHRITQVSGGGLGDVSPGAGANVQGVVSISADGSHIYFVALGVLTTLPNGSGQTATAAAPHLYAYDTDTGETKFVATLLRNAFASDQQLWGIPEPISSHEVRLGQTTPDGRYLAFASYAKLITAGPEADTSGAQQVYRYDFRTGKIIRVSLGHEGYANNGNVPSFNAIIGPADDASEAASPTVNDSNRSISEDGETIVFISAAQLQSTDVAGGSNKVCEATIKAADGAGCEVYVWHNGSVNLVSDGQDPNGAVYAGMSATGSDVFFQTRTQLTGQDTDSLGDIYDARVNGGFPAPTPEPSCSGEACQGSQASAPTFAAPGTASFTGGGNLSPGSTSFPPPPVEPKPKPLTRTQKLIKALKQCKKDRKKSKRKSCEKEARSQYGPKTRRKVRK
jgi:hypothetical protein